MAANSWKICCRLLSGACENAASLKNQYSNEDAFSFCVCFFKRHENFQIGNFSYWVVFSQEHFKAQSDILSLLHSWRRIQLGWWTKKASSYHDYQHDEGECKCICLCDAGKRGKWNWLGQRRLCNVGHSMNIVWLTTLSLKPCLKQRDSVLLLFYMEASVHILS